MTVMLFGWRCDTPQLLPNSAAVPWDRYSCAVRAPLLLWFRLCWYSYKGRETSLWLCLSPRASRALSQVSEPCAEIGEVHTDPAMIQSP